VSIPDAPPLTKGFTVGHTPVALDFFWPPILFLDSKTERLGAQRERGRDSKRKKKWLPQKKKKKNKKKKTEERKCRENGGKGPISKTMERDLQGLPTSSLTQHNELICPKNEA
jgi:hypothetical protein